MQITEVRNDILKMAYSPYQNGLLLSDFLLVSEGEKSVLAQVIGIESSAKGDNTNIATLKCCLSVDETGKIGNYLGFTPSIGAEIATVTQEQVISMLTDSRNNICLGYLAQQDSVLFKTEKEFLTNKPLIMMDDYANYNVIVNNIAYINKKLGEKTFIVDFDGSVKVDNAFYVKIGEDFKLPLSRSTLNYIYENELKNENISTQAIVQDIIIELQEYIKTLPEKFLPFSTIKNVIFAQYQENKIPELMILKNKFAKYAQQDFLAENRDDFTGLNEAIRENDLVVIDASELDAVWHKLVLSMIPKMISKECSFITKIDNENSDKKTIQGIYANKALKPVLTVGYDSTNAVFLKSVAKNLILFPPISAVKDFATYSSFMQKLNRDEYVVCGENTLYLTFILKLTYLDSNMAPEYIEREIQKDVDKLYSQGISSRTVQSKDVLPAETEADSIQTNNEISTPADYQDQGEDEVLTDDDLDFLDELDSLDNLDNESGLEQEDELQSGMTITAPDEISEEPPEISKAELAEPLQQEEPQTELLLPPDQPKTDFSPETDTSVLIEPQYNYEQSEAVDIPAQDIYQQEQTEIEVEPQEQQIEPAPIPYNERPIPEPEPIPVYSVPELEVETPADFKEGNFVFHEKYGRGVIEKIMHYGNKTLCSIQFEEVGRRLLDPNLAGLKQV